MTKTPRKKAKPDPIVVAAPEVRSLNRQFVRRRHGNPRYMRRPRHSRQAQ